jgi:hypothetical protein
MTVQQPACGHPRTLRSFVRRTGRVTRAQARALAELWPRFGVEGEGATGQSSSAAWP